MLAPLLALGLAQTHAPEAAARTVTDEAGRRVTLPAKVERVVSLAPNITDILYAVGAGEKVAGITQFAQLPPGAAPKPSVGEPVEPNLERIAALHPDLVLVARTINRLETVESLAKLGIPVYATDTRTVDGMLETIRHVAGLVGEGAAGEELATRLQARLEAIRSRLAGRNPKRVLFVVWEDPLITTGRSTFIADALRWAGAESVVSVKQDWPHLSLEEVVHLQPDALIFPATHTGVSDEIIRSLQTQPGWRNLRAVKQGRVLMVSDAINRPSPALVSVIEQLARELHPAAFAGDVTLPAAPGAAPIRQRERKR
jgi:iron complex transport system substrate-binding protein